MHYKCPNAGGTYTLAPVDTQTPGDMRAPGAATGMNLFEIAMDELAYASGLDPLALRLVNHADEEAMVGRPFTSKALRAALHAGAERFGWDARPPAPRSMRDDRELVVSAGAGGVGHIAVQIASLLGARVAATASGRNRNFLADLGAEAVIDYTEADDLTKAIRAVFPGGVDKVLNCVRGEDANDYVWALKDGGVIVDLANSVSVERSAVKIISNYTVHGSGARLAQLARLFDDGALQVALHDIVPFADAQEALEEVLTGHVRGKVVLRMR